MHDFSIARYPRDKIAVVYLGRIAESGGVDLVLKSSPYLYSRIRTISLPDLD